MFSKLFVIFACVTIASVVIAQDELVPVIDGPEIDPRRCPPNSIRETKNYCLDHCGHEYMRCPKMETRCFCQEPYRLNLNVATLGGDYCILKCDCDLAVAQPEIEP